MPALCMEVKTDKNPASRHQKREVGQLSDHIQWVMANISAQKIIPVFVGPIVGATDTTNPPDDYQVIELEQFRIFAEWLKSALTDATAEALPITLRSTLMTVFTQRELIWPGCLKMLESHHLRNL